MQSREPSTDSRSIQQVGLIGVGTMGSIILKRLLKAHYKVYACDVSEKAKSLAQELGARVVDLPKDAAQSTELILLSLPGPKQIEEVVLGKDGLIAHLKNTHIVVDLSTVDPATTRRMTSAVVEQGASYLDAPILGRPASVGRWILPVGGEREALESCRSVLETFASKAVLVGPSGSGNTLKLLNQLMFSTINAITSEVLAICKKTGLSQKVLFETISSSGAATVSGLFCEVAKKIVEKDFEPIFSIELLCKDAGLGIEMARNSGAPPVIASLVQTFNEIAKDTGLGKEDTSALFKVYERLYQRSTPYK